MDKQQARKVIEKAIDLVELCAQYQAKHGKNTPDIDSSEQAWELNQRIYEKQREIASLLDDDAVDMENITIAGLQPYSGHMRGNQASAIVKVALGLITACVAQEYNSTMGTTYITMLLKDQYRLARMLDPKAVRDRHGMG